MCPRKIIPEQKKCFCPCALYMICSGQHVELCHLAFPSWGPEGGIVRTEKVEEELKEIAKEEEGRGASCKVSRIDYVVRVLLFYLC